MNKVVDTVAPAWDIVTPATIRNSQKKLMPLPSSSMQTSQALFKGVSNNDFVQQFLALNITYTDNDIQKWMSCDGSDYEHLDNQGIISLVSGDYGKETDEDVEEDSYVLHTQKCPITLSEAMDKIDYFLAYYRCQSDAKRQKNFHNLLNSVSFLLKNKKKL